MRILDNILYKRLERIRGDLNFYIATKLEEKHYGASMPMMCPQVRNEKTPRKIDKFLDIMKLEEDVSDFADEDLWESEEEVSHSQVPVTPPEIQMSVRPPEIQMPAFAAKSEQKKSIDEVLESKTETFSTMLLRLIDEKGLKDSEVYKNANIDRRLFSKIRGDEDYVPSKKTAIAFCLALQLDMQEAKKLLEAAGYALSCASRFDLIIMFLIENKEFNIHFANIVLEDYGEGTLSK